MTTIMPNYSVGEDCFQDIPEVLQKYHISKVVCIGGKKALASSSAEVVSILEQAKIEVTDVIVYGTNSTQATIDRLISTSSVQEADAILGFGGGRALDTVKMVALETGKPCFTIPTICSNCSSATAISVIYNEDHTVNRYGYPEAPLHIFINTRIIAQAPEKYFWAGIGDGISKAPEVEHAAAAFEQEVSLLPHTAVLGRAIALSSKDAFYLQGEKGLQDVKANQTSKAVEEIALAILVSTGYASNLVNQKEFYLNSAHAHAFYNASLAVQRSGEYLHGAVVAFGVLVLHAYYQEYEELNRVLHFNKRLDLPTTLADLGLTSEDIPTIVKASTQTSEYQHLPFDTEQFAQAIVRADALGRDLI